jgi:hypothetical protein
VGVAVRRRLAAAIVSTRSLQAAPESTPFRLEEATIGDIQSAILRGELTSTDSRAGDYLRRIKAYDGSLWGAVGGAPGPFTTIKNAGQFETRFSTP